MLKLSAKLPDGQVWITNSKIISILCQFAESLGASSYSISVNGSVVYEIDHFTVMRK